MSALVPRTRRRAVLGVWSEHPVVDVVLAGGVVVVALGPPVWRDAADVLAAVTVVDLTGLYHTLVGLAGVLLGFIMAAFSIYRALTPTERLERLVRHHGRTIDRTFLVCMRSSAVAAAAFLALAVAAATGATGLPARVAAYAVTALLALRTVRLLWLFTALTDTSPPAAPTVGSDG